MSFITGAGKGMKSPRKRNFEAGILTDDPKMLLMNILIRFFCSFSSEISFILETFRKFAPKSKHDDESCI